MVKMNDVLKKVDVRKRITNLLNSLDDFELGLIEPYLKAEKEARNYLNQANQKKRGWY